MSYIRSWTNPEKLYIRSDGENVIISEGNKEAWPIPMDIFEGLIKKFHCKHHDYPCEYKGAKVEEVWVYEGNDVNLIITQNEHKVKLSYKSYYVIMYNVTWEYIIYSNIQRFPIKSKSISALPVDLQKAVNKEIREELRYEALTILLLTTDENREEFLKYYREKKGNICCLLLDKAKEDLVKQKILKQNNSDRFGIKNKKYV